MNRATRAASPERPRKRHLLGISAIHGFPKQKYTESNYFPEMAARQSCTAFSDFTTFGGWLGVGHYYKREAQPQRWRTGAVRPSVGDPFELSPPRALRGGNGMQRSGIGRVDPIVTTDAPTSGLVSRVRDGDTIEVGGRTIGIAALDCAESGRIVGDAAKRRMRALVSGQHVTCSLTGKRSYNRWIGSCRLSDGRNIADVLIRERLCRRWR